MIGDVHGRDDLLASLLQKLEGRGGARQLVLVGDYVDRGPQSRAVLERLQALDAVCLKGNHEVMLLEFLDNPTEKAARWLRNGGFQTLESFGIELAREPTVAMLEEARDALRAGLGAAGEAWLRGLPLVWQSGNLLVTHAGPDPARPIEGQPDKVFLWGHNRFLRDARADGLWVAHGHWMRDRAAAGDGRIAVDTGAWDSGRLSAALIDPDGRIEFVDTRQK